MNKPVVGQAFRFISVGVFAASVHLGVVMLLVERVQYLPLIANIIGFACAFQCSYWGHRHWTFRLEHSKHAAAYTKLLIVQLGNFAANEALFALLLSLHVSYLAALLLVLMVMPIATFTLSKWWVFR